MAFTSASAALSHITVSEVLPGRRGLVWLSSKETIGDATKKLCDQNVTAAPVFDTSSWKFLGFLDIRGLVLYLVWGKLGGGSDKSSGAVLSELSKQQQFASESVADLMNVKWAAEDSLQVQPTDDLIKVVQFFSRGAHRALVCLHDHPVLGETSLETKYRVLTATDVVRFIYHQHNAFSKLLDATLYSLGLVTDRVITMKNDESVLEGLRVASGRILPAVPVVTRVSNTLVANLSASDLRRVSMGQLTDLTLQINSFLDKYSPKSLRPCALHSSATLHSAVRLMLQQRLHRVWIVNAENQPVGVISMTDLLVLVNNKLLQQQ